MKHNAQPQAEQIRQVMTAFYDALHRQDSGAWNALVTPDFVAFDAGLCFRGNQLLHAVGRALAAGRLGSWKLGPMKVRIRGDWAFVTYINHALSSDLDHGAWQESALLQCTRGKWRLKFLHSSEMKRSQA